MSNISDTSPQDIVPQSTTATEKKGHSLSYYMVALFLSVLFFPGRVIETFFDILRKLRFSRQHSA